MSRPQLAGLSLRTLPTMLIDGTITSQYNDLALNPAAAQLAFNVERVRFAFGSPRLNVGRGV